MDTRSRKVLRPGRTADILRWGLSCALRELSRHSPASTCQMPLASPPPTGATKNHLRTLLNGGATGLQSHPLSGSRGDNGRFSSKSSHDRWPITQREEQNLLHFQPHSTAESEEGQWDCNLSPRKTTEENEPVDKPPHAPLLKECWPTQGPSHKGVRNSKVSSQERKVLGREAGRRGTEGRRGLVRQTPARGPPPTPAPEPAAPCFRSSRSWLRPLQVKSGHHLRKAKEKKHLGFPGGNASLSLPQPPGLLGADACDCQAPQNVTGKPPAAARRPGLRGAASGYAHGSLLRAACSATETLPSRGRLPPPPNLGADRAEPSRSEAAAATRAGRRAQRGRGGRGARGGRPERPGREGRPHGRRSARFSRPCAERGDARKRSGAAQEQ